MNAHHRISRRTLLQGAAVSGIAVGLGVPARGQPAPAKPRQIVVNASGGAMGEAMKEAYVAVFEQRTGIPVVLTSPHDLGKLKAMVESGNVEWNVTEINAADARRAARLGLLEKIDEKIVDRSIYPKEARDPHLLTTSVYSTVLAYRKDVFKTEPPKTWADFWDVKRFPGPRAMQNSPVDNLEFALLADGAKAESLYPLDVDRAFKKLSEIKQHVSVWWTTGAQQVQILVDKEAVISPAWNGRMYRVVKEGAPIDISWDQGLIKQAYFAIPRGAKDVYWGQQFLSAMMDPKAQARFANSFVSPGLNPEALKFSDQRVIAYLPTTPENLKVQFWQDDKWWDLNVDIVRERWQRWILG